MSLEIPAKEVGQNPLDECSRIAPKDLPVVRPVDLMSSFVLIQALFAVVDLLTTFYFTNEKHFTYLI